MSSKYSYSQYNGLCCANCHWWDEEYCDNINISIEAWGKCDLFSTKYDKLKDRKEINHQLREEKKRKEYLKNVTG